MNKSAPKIANRDLATTKEHRFSLLNVEFSIPAGTKVNDCLDDISMFGREAIEVLIEEAANSEASESKQTLFAALHLMQLSLALHSAAHERLITAGALAE